MEEYNSDVSNMNIRVAESMQAVAVSSAMIAAAVSGKDL